MSQVPTPPAAARDPARASLGIQALLAVMVCVLFSGVFLGAFLTKEAGLVHDLTELLKFVVVGVFSYYFGSSVGSRLKGAAGQGAPHG